MISIKPLLNENKPSYADIAQVLNSRLLKEWSNMKFIESLNHNFSFHDEEKTKEIVLQCLTEFGVQNVIATKIHDHLATKMFEVINSRPQLRASVRGDMLCQGYKDAETSLANDINTWTEQKQKKRKALHKKEFKTLSRTEQIKKLTEFYGIEGVLDLTRKTSIPKKIRKRHQSLKKSYGLPLPYLLKKEEHDLLKEIGQCRNKEALYAAVKDINPFTKGSALPYIKQAVQKLYYLYNNSLLENHNHNKDCDLFDYTFASEEEYMTKRSECHSRIIKSLKGPNVKLDFIFCNTYATGINDVLICEDKLTENKSKKTRKSREKLLVYWRSILHYSNALEHLSSTSCRFNKLNLLTSKDLVGPFGPI
ncbi:hypothetical protein AB4K20DRAFT_1974204 [Rhizopus microsporus]